MECEKELVSENLIEKIVHSQEVKEMDSLKEKLSKLREKLYTHAERLEIFTIVGACFALISMPVTVELFKVNAENVGLLIMGTVLYFFFWLLGGVLLGNLRYESKKSWYTSPLISEIDLLNSQYDTKVREASQILINQEVQYNLINELNRIAVELKPEIKAECENKILYLSEGLMKNNFIYVLDELKEIYDIFSKEKNYEQANSNLYFDTLKERFSPKKADIRHLL